MKDQEQLIKASLKDSLPYGSNAEIKRRLSSEHKRNVSSSLIGNILNPDKDTWDNDIISIALDIAREDALKRKSIESKAAGLLII